MCSSEGRFGSVELCSRGGCQGKRELRSSGG